MGLGISFALQRIAFGENGTGPLLLVANSDASIKEFFDRLIDVMFPPGERSSSTMSIDSTEASNGFFYEVRSRAGVASVSLSGVQVADAEFVRRTLTECGSIPILFGSSEGEELRILNPAENAVYRTMAIVDGELVYGGTERLDWRPLMDMASSELSLLG